ncbi:MAG: esterase family protein [Acidimicrobiia bacterium]|nr:esterase family protein [Acidimicrobiia bacterium]
MGSGGSRLRAVAWICALSVAVATPAAPAAAAASAVEPGVSLVSAEPAERGEVLSLWSPALGAETKVRVLLPDGYDDDTARTWPVLYLLHGGGDSWTAWTEPDKGDAAALTAASPFVVVMPDGGPEGWYTDNYGWGAGGPRWETYHIRELLPFVEARYRVTPGRRAVAGLSMGGHGALGYAARHPELFAAAASFSGVDDLMLFGPLSVWFLASFELGPHHVTAGMVWGDILGDQVRFRARNPADLAANLTHTAVFLRWGDGKAVAPDKADWRKSLAELFLAAMNESFVAKLTAAGGAATVVRRGGTHAWKYWREDLTASLPALAAAVAAPRPVPGEFDYVSADPAFSAWGWDVTVTRPFLEFAALRGAGRTGFVARGTGAMHVRTAAYYCAGAAYEVTQTRRGVAAHEAAFADADGRLSVDVDLGPAHPFQDWTLPAILLRDALGDGYLQEAAVAVAGPATGSCP